MANGYSIGAVVGKADVMRAIEKGLFSATFFVSSLEMAASMATIGILKDEPVIIREKGSGSRHAILSLLRSKGVEPSVLVEAGSVEFIKEYVMKGRGISFLYKPEIQMEAKMGLLNKIKYTTSEEPKLYEERNEIDPFPRENFVDTRVIRVDNILTAKGHAFIDFALEIWDWYDLYEYESEREETKQLFTPL